MNRSYVGDRAGTGRAVRIIDGVGGPTRWLDPRPSQRLRNHSPDGFEWGYAGSGPAQLALAIVLDVYPEEIAQRFYQDFKEAFIARADKAGFTIQEEDVRQFIQGRIACL